MKSKNILITALALIICLCVLAVCIKVLQNKLNDSNTYSNSVTDSSSTPSEGDRSDGQTENADDDSFTICIYSDKNSEEYASLGEYVTFLDGCSDSEESDKVRFTCSQDGIDVMLEAVDYIADLDYFHSYMPIFNTSTNAGTVYEFDAYLSENLPSYRLYAEKDGFSAVWYLQSELMTESNVFEIKGELRQAQIPDKSSPIISLCKVYARNSVLSGEDVGYLPDLFWNTVAASVCAVRELHDGVAPEGKIQLEEWLVNAYAQALFPGQAFPGINTWDSIEYSAEYNEKYIIDTLFPDIEDATDLEFIDVLDDGTVEVGITVTVSEGEVLCRITIESTPEEENPFGWNIVGFDA